MVAPAAVAVLAAVVAVALAHDAGVAGPSAVPKVARALAGAIVFFGVTGYAPARLLVPDAMRAYLPLLVLPVGAAWSGLALTLIGFLQVPFDASLPLLLAASAVAAIVVRIRLGPARPDASANDAAGGVAMRLLLPAVLVGLIAAVALIPVFRAGFTTVSGENPDAHLSVGSAYFLQHAPPRAVRPGLPLDRMPLVWRSKYPIYYALAGASTTAGLDPTETFAAVSALILALTGIAALLFTRCALRASPAAAVLALVLVPLDRSLLHVTMHPYYNQLWGEFALLLVLAFGFRLLRQPNPRDAVLTLLFAAVGAFAYPLMLPFPVAILGLAAIARWHRTPPERRPRIGAAIRAQLRRRRGLWAIGAVIALPAALVLTAGIMEKASGATHVLVPGSDLGPWSGDLPDPPPFPGFFGIDGSGVAAWTGAIAVLAAASVGLWRATAREVVMPLTVTAGLAFAFAAFFAVRAHGGYLYFKDLAFLAPVLVACAAAGLVWLVAEARGDGSRVLACGAAVTIVALFVLGARVETDHTFDQLTRPLAGLKSWNHRLPEGASVRLDLVPGGEQLWAGYMLSEHPLSATAPVLNTTYPHAPRSIRADYVLADREAPRRPLGARGPVLLENSRFRVYRLRRDLPGPDASSKRMIDGTGASLGG